MPYFLSWLDNKMPTIKKTMLANVRKAEGLHSPQATLYTLCHYVMSLCHFKSTQNVIGKSLYLSSLRTSKSSEEIMIPILLKLSLGEMSI